MAARLARRFRAALHLALADRGDVARGIKRGYRMLLAYERGERRVTEPAARGLAEYLRQRAARLLAAAKDLERVIEQQRRGE